MRILLVGEYSRLHNSLKEGLIALGRDVTLVSTGDFFKDYPSDIRLQHRWNSGLKGKIRILLYRLTGIDLTERSVVKQFMKNRDDLKGYDIVQLINESPFTIQPESEIILCGWLAAHNKKLFLLSCGADHLSVTYAMGDQLPYTILDAYKKGKAPYREFHWALKYLNPRFKALHEFVYRQITGVIASDLDYHLPLQGHPKYLGLIPNPVNTKELLCANQPIDKKIRVFIGINRSNYFSKGINYFEEALDIVSETHGEKMEVEIAENLPYREYIQKFDRAHIVLDQVLGQDQGYNALEAMAKGKVVFTGAGEPFMRWYSLEDTVAINAVPDAPTIAANLIRLLDDPDQIGTIGARAREFVLREHDHKMIARKYLDVWGAN